MRGSFKQFKETLKKLTSDYDAIIKDYKREGYRHGDCEAYRFGTLSST